MKKSHNVAAVSVYAVITKREFAYFASRERFLRLQKPLTTIPLTEIQTMEHVSDNGFVLLVKQLNCIVYSLKTLFLDSKIVSKSKNNSKTTKNLKIVPKRISFIEEVNHKTNNSREVTFEQNETKEYKFFSPDVNLVLKWKIVIDYLMSN